MKHIIKKDMKKIFVLLLSVAVMLSISGVMIAMEPKGGKETRSDYAGKNAAAKDQDKRKHEAEVKARREQEEKKKQEELEKKREEKEISRVANFEKNKQEVKEKRDKKAKEHQKRIEQVQQEQRKLDAAKQNERQSEVEETDEKIAQAGTKKIEKLEKKSTHANDFNQHAVKVTEIAKEKTATIQQGKQEGLVQEEKKDNARVVRVQSEKKQFQINKQKKNTKNLQQHLSVKAQKDAGKEEEKNRDYPDRWKKIRNKTEELAKRDNKINSRVGNTSIASVMQQQQEREEGLTPSTSENELDLHGLLPVIDIKEGTNSNAKINTGKKEEDLNSNNNNQSVLQPHVQAERVDDSTPDASENEGSSELSFQPSNMEQVSEQLVNSTTASINSGLPLNNSGTNNTNNVNKANDTTGVVAVTDQAVADRKEEESAGSSGNENQKNNNDNNLSEEPNGNSIKRAESSAYQAALDATQELAQKGLQSEQGTPAHNELNATIDRYENENTINECDNKQKVQNLEEIERKLDEIRSNVERRKKEVHEQSVRIKQEEREQRVREEQQAEEKRCLSIENGKKIFRERKRQRAEMQEQSQDLYEQLRLEKIVASGQDEDWFNNSGNNNDQKDKDVNNPSQQSQVGNLTTGIVQVPGQNTEKNVIQYGSGDSSKNRVPAKVTQSDDSHIQFVPDTLQQSSDSNDNGTENENDSAVNNNNQSNDNTGMFGWVGKGISKIFSWQRPSDDELLKNLRNGLVELTSEIDQLNNNKELTNSVTGAWQILGDDKKSVDEKVQIIGKAIADIRDAKNRLLQQPQMPLLVDVQPDILISNDNSLSNQSQQQTRVDGNKNSTSVDDAGIILVLAEQDNSSDSNNDRKEDTSIVYQNVTQEEANNEQYIRDLNRELEEGNNANIVRPTGIGIASGESRRIQSDGNMPIVEQSADNSHAEDAVANNNNQTNNDGLMHRVGNTIYSMFGWQGSNDAEVRKQQEEERKGEQMAQLMQNDIKIADEILRQTDENDNSIEPLKAQLLSMKEALVSDRRNSEQGRNQLQQMWGVLKNLISEQKKNDEHVSNDNDTIALDLGAGIGLQPSVNVSHLPDQSQHQPVEDSNDNAYNDENNNNRLASKSSGWSMLNVFGWGRKSNINDAHMNALTDQLRGIHEQIAQLSLPSNNSNDNDQEVNNLNIWVKNLQNYLSRQKDAMKNNKVLYNSFAKEMENLQKAVTVQARYNQVMQDADAILATNNHPQQPQQPQQHTPPVVVPATNVVPPVVNNNNTSSWWNPFGYVRTAAYNSAQAVKNGVAAGWNATSNATNATVNYAVGLLGGNNQNPPVQQPQHVPPVVVQPQIPQQQPVVNNVPPVIVSQHVPPVIVQQQQPTQQPPVYNYVPVQQPGYVPVQQQPGYYSYNGQWYWYDGYYWYPHIEQAHDQPSQLQQPVIDSNGGLVVPTIETTPQTPVDTINKPIKPSITPKPKVVTPTPEKESRWLFNVRYLGVLCGGAAGIVSMIYSGYKVWSYIHTTELMHNKRALNKIIDLANKADEGAIAPEEFDARYILLAKQLTLLSNDKKEEIRHYAWTYGYYALAAYIKDECMKDIVAHARKKGLGKKQDTLSRLKSGFVHDIHTLSAALNRIKRSIGNHLPGAKVSYSNDGV